MERISRANTKATDESVNTNNIRSNGRMEGEGNYVSSRKQINGHGHGNGHRQSLNHESSYDDDTMSDHDDGHNSHSTLIRHVPLIEDIVMGKENTVVDEEHREDFFSRDMKWTTRCVRTWSLMRAIAVAHLAAFWDRRLSKYDKKVCKAWASGILTFLFGLSIYLTRDRHGYVFSSSVKVRAKPIAFTPTHHIETPLSLVTEFIGDTSTSITATSSSSSSSSSSSLSSTIPFMEKAPPPLEQRPWFEKGKQHPPTVVRMSPMLEHNLANTGMPWRRSHVPLFWHIPRSAGTCMDELVSSCLNLIQAKSAATQHQQDQVLEVFTNIHNGARYVNVNTMRMPGIQHANNLGLVDSELARVVTTMFVQDIPILFSRQHKGQLFTIIRHPVSRSISLFYYLRTAYESQAFSPPQMTLTLDEYARSSRLEFNWMTRVLSGQLSGTLTQEHVDLAKTIVRRKLIVGLLDDMDETLRRFAFSFRWHNRIGDREKTCLNKLANYDWPNDQQHQPDYPKLDENSKTWYLLEEKNQYDMQLYYYARTQFEAQAVMY